MQGTWVPFLVGELRSHMPRGAAKKRKTKTNKRKPLLRGALPQQGSPTLRGKQGCLIRLLQAHQESGGRTAGPQPLPCSLSSGRKRQDQSGGKTSEEGTVPAWARLPRREALRAPAGQRPSRTACGGHLLAALWTEWTEHRAKGSGRTGGGWGLLPAGAPRQPSLRTRRLSLRSWGSHGLSPAISVHLCFCSAPQDGCSACTWLLCRARPRLPSSWVFRKVLSPEPPVPAPQVQGCAVVDASCSPSLCRTWMPASARIQSRDEVGSGLLSPPRCLCLRPLENLRSGPVLGFPCSGPYPVVLGSPRPPPPPGPPPRSLAIPGLAGFRRRQECPSACQPPSLPPLLFLTFSL